MVDMALQKFPRKTGASELAPIGVFEWLCYFAA